MVVPPAVLVLGVPLGLVAAELVGDSGRRTALENRRDPAPDATRAAKVEHPAPEVARQARGRAERRRVVGRERGPRVQLTRRAADPYRRLRPRSRCGSRCGRVESVPGEGE